MRESKRRDYLCRRASAQAGDKQTNQEEQVIVAGKNMLDTQNQESLEDVRGRCCSVGLRRIGFKRVAAPLQYAFRQHISSLIAQRDVLAMTGREMFQDRRLETKLSTWRERKIHLKEH